MSSSGAAMNGLTVPARNASGGDCEQRSVGSAGRSQSSVDGLSDTPHICGLVCAQSIVVMLQMFDNGLQIANPRPESSALKDQTIVPIHSLTQQRLGHTNSVEILRTCEGRWTTH